MNGWQTLRLLTAVVWFALGVTAPLAWAAPLDEIDALPDEEVKPPAAREPDEPSEPDESPSTPDEPAVDVAAEGKSLVWSLESRLKLPPVAAARQALAKGDIAASAEHFREAAEEFPSLPPPLVLMAQLHLVDGRITKGQQTLRTAAAQHKNHPELYLTCGQLALAQGRNIDAWVHLERALNTKPPKSWSKTERKRLEVMCYHGLASVAERDKDWPAAAAILSKWDPLQPEDAALLDRWGKALFLAGQREEGEEKFRQSHQLEPSMNPPELSIAALYTSIGEYAAAESHYQKALEKFPQDGRVHYEFGGALLVAGRPSEAREQLDKAVDVGSSAEGFAANVAAMQGLVARSLKDYEVAEGFFTHALRTTPGHFQAATQLPLVLVEQVDEAKRERALQAATILAEKYPRSPQALTTAGWVFFRLGKLEEAEQKLTQACSGDTAPPESVYYLAQILLKRGKVPEAKRAVEALTVAISEPGLFLQREEARQWLEDTALLLQ